MVSEHKALEPDYSARLERLLMKRLVKPVMNIRCERVFPNHDSFNSDIVYRIAAHVRFAGDDAFTALSIVDGDLVAAIFTRGPGRAALIQVITNGLAETIAYSLFKQPRAQGG